MKTANRRIGTGLGILALVCATAVPAQAAPPPGQPVNTGSTQWCVTVDVISLIVPSIQTFDTAASGTVCGVTPDGATVTGYWNADAWPFTAAITVPDFFGYTPGSLTTQTSADGDVVVRGAATTSPDGELGMTGEYRFYAAGDLMRAMITYTNLSDAPVSFGAASGVWSIMSETPLSGGERWVVTSEPDSSGTGPGGVGSAGLIGAIAWRGPAGIPVWVDTTGTGLAVIPGETSDPSVATTWATTLAPGESIRYAFYLLVAGGADAPGGPTRDQITLAAQALFDGPFSGRLTAGLDPGTHVANWGTVASPTPDPDPAPPAVPVPGKPHYTG